MADVRPANGPRIACTAGQAAVLGIPAYTTTPAVKYRAEGSAIYAVQRDGSGHPVGVMSTPELAAEVVAALGAVGRLLGDQ